MAKTPDILRFQAPLHRPAHPADADWLFLRVPADASARLGTRSMVSVEGSFAGQPLLATLQPDGEGGHWLKVDRPLLDAAGVDEGDAVHLEMARATIEPEPEVPDDLASALADHPAALATWRDITAVARRDWIAWVTSGRKAETRSKRIGVACDKLAKGQRRACCFDRSGMFDKSLRAPTPAR